MKRMTTIAAVALAALATTTSVFADEAFDNLVKLAKTPVAEITTANAMQVFDAGVATTNNTALVNVASKNILSFADMYAKIKGNPLFVSAFRALPSTDEERLMIFNDNVDAWCKLSLDDRKKYKAMASILHICDRKNKIGVAFSNPEAIVAACEKIAATEGTVKFGVISILIYQYGIKRWEGTVASSLPETYKSWLIDFIVAGGDDQYWNSCIFIDFVLQLYSVEKDYSNVSVCLLASVNKPVWKQRNWGKTGNASYISNIYYDRNIGASTMKTLRKNFLDNVAETDVALLKIAGVQDKIDNNKETTKSIFAKLVEPTSKVETAIYLNDNDKLIDTLIVADDSLSAETLEKAIMVINTFDPDWRSADVLKALRVINKKYTLKLYDDRDTWEPVLSKVRALIDTYGI